VPDLNCPACTGPVTLVSDGAGSACPSCGARFGAAAHDAATLCADPSIVIAPAATPANPFSADFMSRYEMVGFLGKGAMGAVFLMRQLNLDRLVAVKAVRNAGLTDKENRRLIKESRVVAQLSHPAIRAIHDAGIDGAVPYMVCEYVEGETLAARLAESGALELADALKIALALLEGLEVAHQQGIVHRDVKPGNILLDRRDRPKLVDFGLATMLTMNTIETVSGRILGTPRYMSPEQCNGLETTAASDLYAMGLVLFEMLTGALPFDGPGPMNFMDQHVHAAPRAVSVARPGLPEGLDAIVARALEKRPADRHASAAAFAEALLEVYSQLTAVSFTRTTRLRVAPLKPAPEPVASPALLTGRYRLVRALGHSTLGEMWLAHDQTLEEDVAVRLLPERVWSNPAARAVMVREAKNALRLAHPNVVHVFHLEPGHPPFLVREFVTGPSLATEIARREQAHARPFSLAEALSVLEGVAAALEHAHARGVLHRDLNPTNVVLEASDSGTLIPRVTDFGMAAALDALPDAGPASPAEQACRAPEVLAGAEPDVRADVYALGALLYQMSTLALPARAADGELAWAAVPASAVALLRAALSPDRDRRPASATAFLEALRAATTAAAPPVSRPPDAETGLTRRALFQLVTDEAFKDGVVEEWENRALVALTEYLQLPLEEARSLAWISHERFQKGRLGSSRPLSPRTLYSKALYFAHAGEGLTAEREWMLAGLRKIFEIAPEVHDELLTRVKSKLA